MDNKDKTSQNPPGHYQSPDEKVDYGNSPIKMSLTDGSDNVETIENKEKETGKDVMEKIENKVDEEETVLNNPNNAREAPGESLEGDLEKSDEEKKLNENIGGKTNANGEKPEIRYEVKE